MEGNRCCSVARLLGLLASPAEVPELPGLDPALLHVDLQVGALDADHPSQLVRREMALVDLLYRGPEGDAQVLVGRPSCPSSTPPSSWAPLALPPIRLDAEGGPQRVGDDLALGPARPLHLHLYGLELLASWASKPEVAAIDVRDEG